jgi:O-acetyl-ADP-ribose deacetylase (regulator of RNase III)
MKIEHKTGNIFDSNASFLVNPVNCVGVMGKGLALQFKQRYPGNFRAYKQRCNSGDMKIGEPFIQDIPNPTPMPPRFIVNFPTKDHWRAPSEYEYIARGLIGLSECLFATESNSIAFPPIGCGLGGLKPQVVQVMIEALLQKTPLQIQLYNFGGGN